VLCLSVLMELKEAELASCAVSGQSNDGSDKERNLRAVHVTALPRGGDTYHSKGAADRLRLFRWRPTAYCAYTLRLNDPPRLFPLNSIASLMSALSQEDPFGCGPRVQ
jgi:hypothetical protein